MKNNKKEGILIAIIVVILVILVTSCSSTFGDLGCGSSGSEDTTWVYEPEQASTN